MIRRPISSRRVSQVPSARWYGAYCTNADIVCLPGGATDGSYAVWKYSSAKPGDGMPRWQSSNAAWASSIGTVIDTGARFGQSASGRAVHRGSRDSPQLSLTTGLVVRHAPIRDLNVDWAASPSNPSVTLGSAFDTTARLRMISPPSSTTPLPGRISATPTPQASTAPASAAASPIANEIRPMPPSTYPHAIGVFSRVPWKCINLIDAVPGLRGPAQAPITP
jgi:hypothetical protein